MINGRYYYWGAALLTSTPAEPSDDGTEPIQLEIRDFQVSEFFNRISPNCQLSLMLRMAASQVVLIVRGKSHWTKGGQMS